MLMLMLVLLMLVLVLLMLVLLVLVVWTVQSSQVCLAMEGRGDLERRGGRCHHAAKGQGSLVWDTGPWHSPSGGQSLELGVDLVMRRGQVGAEAGAWGVGRMGWVRVRHVHAGVLRVRERVGEGAGGRVLAWVTGVD